MGLGQQIGMLSSPGFTNSFLNQPITVKLVIPVKDTNAFLQFNVRAKFITFSLMLSIFRSLFFESYGVWLKNCNSS